MSCVSTRNLPLSFVYQSRENGNSYGGFTDGKPPYAYVLVFKVGECSVVSAAMELC